MALIKCFECGHDVSTYADKCQNCGAPVQNEPPQAETQKGRMKCLECKCIFDKIHEICPNCKTKTNRIIAKPGEKFPGETRNPYLFSNAKVKCPTCGSNQIEKISLSDKVGSAVLFGVFAISKIGKTFRCGNCGFKW